ncbi:MAG: oligosaccharide flippase family protein [Candidatus Thiodiazotropha sp. (ex Monitilora ramsayi)]|nr:oligosaccharide flippase family protein [Candidatus Thiodiazotropha sp. (ex Monitilora ramsayi)]
MVFARTFAARGIAAIGSLVLIVILGRLYGPTGVGILALTQGVLLGASVFAKYGMDNGLMRFIGQDQESIYIYKLLSWTLIFVFVLSLIIALAIFFGRDNIEIMFQSKGLSSVLVGISIATPAYALGYILSGFFKGIRKPATACLMEGGSVALVSAFIILLINLFDPAFGIASIGVAYAIATWLVLAQGILYIYNRYAVTAHNKYHICKIEFKHLKSSFISSSHDFFIMNLATLVQSTISILIAGWLLTSSELGLFKSSEQTAMLISFVLIVINAILPPRFAHLFNQGKLHELELLGRQGARFGILLASPLIIACLFFPYWVLGIIGEDFKDAAPLLQILGIAQLINLATGSVGFMLSMTGHERIMRNISWISSIIGILLLFLLIPLFSAIGAAVSLAVILITQNLIALYFVWKKLGIWMLPIPNLFRLAGIEPQDNK